MLSIEFHYRPSTRKDKDEGKIFIRIIYDRRTGSITLPFVVSKPEWEDMQLHLRSGIAFTNTQRFLLKEKELLHSIARDLANSGELSVNGILTVYRFRKSKQGLVQLVSALRDELISQGKERTARAYGTTLRMLLLFAGKDDMLGEELTSQFLENYEQYMRSNRKSLNTISFYMRNLRAIYNKGIQKGYISNGGINPFAKVYTKVAPTRKRALSKVDLRKLENLLDDPATVLSNREKKALCLFLFSFHCRGMCFVDMAYLKKEDLSHGIIHYYRRKTGQYMEIKITPAIHKYMKLLAVGSPSPYLFDLIGENPENTYRKYCTRLRRQNQLLHRIGYKAGFSGPLTTHMARHSWATVAKMEQIPVEVISEALGHSRIDTTYRYLGSFGESVLDRANRKVSKAISVCLNS